MLGRKERILILVKAYPAYSKKYGYVICTAGLTEDGEWRRIFPIPLSVYREKRFEKRTWIEVEIRDEKPEHRKESRKIYPHSVRILNEEDIEEVRKMLKSHVTTLESLKKAYKEDRTSLGVVKPLLLKFDFDPRKSSKRNTIMLYQRTLIPTIKVEELPYWPKYRFKCAENCPGHSIICEDIEAIELIRKLRKKYADDGIVREKAKQKLYAFMKGRDLYFIMGTHYKYATWLIVGLFYPPRLKSRQLTEFLNVN